MIYREMTFFIDRNFARKIASVLSECGISTIHHNDIFSPTTSDDEIIKYVAYNGYVLLTNDERMRFAHRAALDEYRPFIVFVSNTVKDQKIDLQIAWYQTTFVNSLSERNVCLRVRIAIGGDLMEK